MDEDSPASPPAAQSGSAAPMGRRQFIRNAALGAGMLVLPSYLTGQSKSQQAPSRKLNIALVGVAGQGLGSVDGFKDENIVAFCDVDPGRVKTVSQDKRDWMQKLSKSLTEVMSRGNVRWFTDYREMFAEMADQIDVVAIAIPDHMHFPVAMSAINLGKHVYCEKPLTHTVEEARLLREAAAKAGVVTQMGNQGHSNDGARVIREWLQAGVIGPVREVHSWTNRPVWKQGWATPPDHSLAIPVPPRDFRWDLWLGIAADRPYDPAYHPFSWRGWWDFGTGAIGDMACHVMDGAYWGLDLHYPTSVEAVAASPVSDVSPPMSSLLRFEFPARGSMPPVTYNWYDGGLLPPVPESLLGTDLPEGDGSGTFIVGEDGVIYTDTYSSTAKILPLKKMVALRSRFPKRSLRRIRGTHREEFLDAIREGRKADSDFSYSGPFSESVLLGAVALRAGRKVLFDGESCKITNAAEADALLRTQYPKGWILS